MSAVARTPTDTPSAALPWALRQGAGPALDDLLRLGDAGWWAVLAEPSQPVAASRWQRAEDAGWDDLLDAIGGVAALVRPERLDRLEPGGPDDPLRFWLDAAFGLEIADLAIDRPRDAKVFGETLPARLILDIARPADVPVPDGERLAALVRRVVPAWLAADSLIRLIEVPR